LGRICYGKKNKKLFAYFHTFKTGVFEWEFQIKSFSKILSDGKRLATDETTQESQPLSLFEIIKNIDNAKK